MGKTKDSILRRLQDGVVSMDKSAVVLACQEVYAADISPNEAITDGLMKGMQIVSQKYENQEYFVPEVMLCSDALDAGIKILSTFQESSRASFSVDVVIGVIEGDVHDLGKNIVKLMMQSNGLAVYDLGKNVPAPKFIEAAQQLDAKLICLSTMMASTMDKMKQVPDLLMQKGIRNQFTVLIGGAPISQSFADAIGADAYYSNASIAAKKAKQLLTKGT